MAKDVVENQRDPTIMQAELSGEAAINRRHSCLRLVRCFAQLHILDPSEAIRRQRSGNGLPWRAGVHDLTYHPSARGSVSITSSRHSSTGKELSTRVEARLYTV
jgi:hypothetical protein